MSSLLLHYPSSMSIKQRTGMLHTQTHIHKYLHVCQYVHDFKYAINQMTRHRRYIHAILTGRLTRISGYRSPAIPYEQHCAESNVYTELHNQLISGVNWLFLVTGLQSTIQPGAELAVAVTVGLHLNQWSIALVVVTYVVVKSMRMLIKCI